MLVGLGTVGCAHSDNELGYQGYPRWRPSAAEQWQQTSKTPAPNDFPADPPDVLPETHFAAGRLFESRGMLDRAIAQYQRAIAVNHHYAEAYHRLGMLLSMAGRRTQALDALNRAVELKPDQPAFRNDLGFEYLLHRRWADARQQFIRAIELDPDLSHAHVNLGIVQSKMGDFDAALASFRAVLPEADAYYNLGLMYRGQRRYAEARAAFECVLAINPDFTAAKTQLAQISAEPTPSDTPALIERAAQARPPKTRPVEPVGKLDSAGASEVQTRHDPDRSAGQPRQDTYARDSLSPRHTETAWTTERIRGETETATTTQDQATIAKEAPYTAPTRNTQTMAATVVPSISEYLRRNETAEVEGPAQPPKDLTHRERQGDFDRSPPPPARKKPAQKTPTADRPTAAREAPRPPMDEASPKNPALPTVDPRSDIRSVVAMLDKEMDSLPEKETTRADTVPGTKSRFRRNVATTPDSRRIGRGDPADTMACTVLDPAEPVGPVSYAPEIVATPFPFDRPTSLRNDGMAERAFSPWTPALNTRPETATASIDPTAAMRELEQRLACVRSEITCLDEFIEQNTRIARMDFGSNSATASAPMLTDSEGAATSHSDRPRDFVTKPATKRAMLVSDKPERKSDKKRSKATRRNRTPKKKATDDNPRAKQRRKKTRKNDTHRTSNDRTDKRPTMASSVLSWERTFEKLEDLRWIALNEIHCVRDKAGKPD
jgi:Tfp pilus assembly protein PilF